MPLLEEPVVAENVTSSSVFISWEFPGGTVDYYRIQYALERLGFDSPNVSEFRVKGNKQSVHINNLMPQTNYVIRVRTENENGESEWSPEAHFKTPGKNSFILIGSIETVHSI